MTRSIPKISKGYIALKESIILNVLSATVDFPTCESIRMWQQINDRLIRSTTGLVQMPPDLNNTGDAVRVFFHIVKKICNSLEKTLVRAEFDDYPDDCYFHGTACIVEMLNRYAKKSDGGDGYSGGDNGHQSPQLPAEIGVPCHAQKEG
ncbi:hypothetical protein HU200_025147 [Digitaria exilis]|uniref:Uncharacterized protein n=1 Tax=Digitaria exilis TaxID=1010633 RepID=A0A835C178_9POAL|nr:hypothetical protein HU200_025147 [Digitaria exilis]